MRHVIEMMRIVHIWYDDGGQIAAVGQPLGGPHHVVPLSRPGMHAFETTVDSGAIADLHRTHRADPVSGRLVALWR